MNEIRNPAEIASQQALDEIYSCLNCGQSFRLEAGAGAGKTYSLVKVLNYLIERHHRTMLQRNQKIACITFTNVARDEILTRTDRNPLIFCETTHSFCWSLISSFQKQLRFLLTEIPIWQKIIANTDGIGDRIIEYTLGHRSIREQNIYLHHDDVLSLTIKLMEYPKFCRIMTDQYPIILIDEYQDTDARWIEAVKTHFLGQPSSPLFGFFGDHWQKIYGNGCGKIEHPAVKEINKKANFRSVLAVVNTLNRMRPELPQFVVNPTITGSVSVFHSNNWQGERQTGSHWIGDLPSEIGHHTLEKVKMILEGNGWDLSSEKTKILMLTHRILANEQGYSSLPNVFHYPDAFTAKDHHYIQYFIDRLEPACDAYSQRKFGAMFGALESNMPFIRKLSDKVSWAQSMDELMKLRREGTVGNVLDYLSKTQKPRLPDTIRKRERELIEYDRASDEPMSDALIEIEKLRAVQYSEIIALRAYHSGFSPFETKHGVKGAEFENVLVVVGRGWNRYNFGEMLELAALPQIPSKKLEAFERNLNLFYVVCSRAKRRLALLFTQELKPTALRTLEQWFEVSNIIALDF